MACLLRNTCWLIHQQGKEGDFLQPWQFLVPKDEHHGTKKGRTVEIVVVVNKLRGRACVKSTAAHPLQPGCS